MILLGAFIQFNQMAEQGNRLIVAFLQFLVGQIQLLSGLFQFCRAATDNGFLIFGKGLQLRPLLFFDYQ
ncbi:hypothetical protein Kalk_10200 [Ketobacter alkanivorans]|uniref:Uncharacterized protein n=1 Tax=Ketobacter alkanivorans TaxID=1917421 RepID=A0A2K9LK79_9GAMM|nr:hypothetical protein Kalk_10200 [Ketobacter alkanivorans]